MRKIAVICIALLLAGFLSLSIAAETRRVATIIELKGSVEVKSVKDKWVAASVGMMLKEGDIIRTKEGSFALIKLEGVVETATVEVKAKSQMRLSKMLENKEAGTQKTLLDLALGDILIKAQKLRSDKSQFEVKTPTSIVGVRGTTFSVSVEALE